MCEDKTATEIIEELMKFRSGVQVISALKYGMTPLIGYVLDNPTEDNITLLVELLRSYSKVRSIFKDELSKTSEALLEAAKKRRKEVEQGFAEENG